ncbi:MAG: AAA family ATPase [Pseudomonadota bacterium]
MGRPDTGAQKELIGRSRERAACELAIARLTAGQGGTILLSGEPGIGKSALAKLCARLAAEAGAAVHWGFAWEAGGAPAYWPWTQCLGALVRTLQADENLIAPLADVLSDRTEPDKRLTLQPDEARFQLLEGVRALLDQVTRERMTVLVLEDLHAADEETLLLLRHLSQHAEGLPLLLIGTYRDVEARAGNSEPLWEITRTATVIRPGRLGADDIKAFLAQRGETCPDELRVQQLLQTTAGNPLFLEGLTDLFTHSGPAEHALPETVQQVIRQQLERLPGATRQMLAAASVLGREFSTASLALLAGAAEKDVQQALVPAIDAGLVDRESALDYRFAHTLYRDVLYRDLESESRLLMHQRYAERLEELIAAGDTSLWSLLATHLELAGPDYRRDTVAALRQAAAYARDRLALDEAANLLERALGIFGEGPDSDPADRCRLNIVYANALSYSGRVREAHACCERAFAVAVALEDASLMAELALTWGQAIVVARIDRRLIGALERSLAALSDEQTKLKARLLGRLAGALQPALDPTGPMRMAREAIRLARETEDEDVLYEVLRSAVSALMDFAPVSERLPLNREFASLARQRADVPGQFRAGLRLMIDAIESGDRGTLDAAILDCCDIADQLGLPHYRWRTASAKAMLATLEGRFDESAALLDQAEALAGAIHEPQATITLAIQRFCLLIEWDSPNAVPLDVIQERLRSAYDSGLGDAEFYIAPLINYYSNLGNREFAHGFIRNEALVERTFAGGDRYTLTMLGALALEADRLDIAKRIYHTLLPAEDACTHLGLLGGGWSSPVAYWLGVLARGLGEPERARRHFDKALAVAEAMCAEPARARIHACIAGLAGDMGDTEQARHHRAIADRQLQTLGMRRERAVPAHAADSPAGIAGGERIRLNKSGEHWRVSFDGKTASIRDTKGMSMLARLLGEPDREIHVLDLAGAGAPDSGDEPKLDAQARREYAERVQELAAELEEAEDMADLGRADALREELEFLRSELARAFGLGGRPRAGGPAERARVNVRRRLKDAMERVERQLPGAGRYLESTVRTGSYCRYTPI